MQGSWARDRLHSAQATRPALASRGPWGRRDLWASGAKQKGQGS